MRRESMFTPVISMSSFPMTAFGFMLLSKSFSVITYLFMGFVS